MPVMTTVQQVLVDNTLIPWIEEAAFMYSMQRFVMAQSVLLKSDLTGWVDRKVSQVLRPGSPSKLSEGVQIPTKKINRKRLATISPQEWGDRYPVTDRRTDTDPENVLAEVVAALGYSLGRKRENLLFAAAIAAAGISGNSITVGTDYTLTQAVQLQTLFEAKAFTGELTHVIHPYQELDVKLELMKLTNAAPLAFRDEFIRSWRFGGFGGLSIAVSGMVPRKVLNRLVIGTATNGNTFKLSFGGYTTAAITYNSTPATLVTNVQAALDALVVAAAADGIVYGAFVVTAPTTNVNNIRIQSGSYVDEEAQLVVGLTVDGDPDLVGLTIGNIRVEEVSALARAPFFERQAVIYDVRKRVSAYQEWLPSYRTLDIGAYETYGVGPWQAERSAYIETDASAPTAVAAP